MQGDHDGEEDDEFEGAVPAAVASSPNLLRTGETEHKDDEAFHTPSCRDVVRDSGSSAASASGKFDADAICPAMPANLEMR